MKLCGMEPCKVLKVRWEIVNQWLLKAARFLVIMKLDIFETYHFWFWIYIIQVIFTGPCVECFVFNLATTLLKLVWVDS